MSIAVIVLNWNSKDDTERCLASIFAQRKVEVKVLLVDNGSTEIGTEEFLEAMQTKYPAIILVRNQKNYGFAGGVNIGLKKVLKDKFEYVGLLNPDAVADKFWLHHLTKNVQMSSPGIVTSLLLHSDGRTIDSSGDWYSIWGLPFPRGRNRPAKTAAAASTVFGGSGGASLYSTDMLRQIGLFDERFFAYYEDVDISFRAQLAGWKVIYEPKAIVYHKRGVSSQKIPGFTVYQTFKNLPLLYIKNVPRGLLWSIGWRFILAYWLMFGNAVKNGSGLPALKGWLTQIYLFWFDALPKRFSIQRNKKVSTSYIRSILWLDLPPDQTGLRKFRKFFTGKP